MLLRFVKTESVVALFLGFSAWPERVRKFMIINCLAFSGARKSAEIAENKGAILAVSGMFATTS